MVPCPTVSGWSLYDDLRQAGDLPVAQLLPVLVDPPAAPQRGKIECVMTRPQISLYWREWSAVRKADPQADRHALHEKALGFDKSHQDLTNKEFDLILGAFRAVSKRTALAPQLRAQRQPKERMLYLVGQLCERLALYVEDVASYVAQITSARVSVSADGQWSLEDADDRPRFRRKANGDLVELPSELKQIVMTLSARLNTHRAAAGHSIHDMLIAVGHPCRCRICHPRQRLSLAMAGPEPSMVTMDEPF